MSNPTPSPPRPKMNVYTFMLLISFVALVIATALLATELMKYGSYPQWNTGGS